MTTRPGILVLALLAGCGGTAHNAAPPTAAPPTPVATATPATAVTEPLPGDPAGPGDAAEPAEPVDQAAPTAADPAAPTDSIGLGTPGTVGQGSGAPGGSGYGARSADPKAPKALPAEVVPGTPEVRGALDKELIRRIIRRHLNEVKFCYEKERTRNPRLQGRVTVQFTIAPTGAVAASIVQSTTLGNPPVEQCFAAAIRRWEFPKPQGGVVVVTYPFVLKAGTE